MRKVELERERRREMTELYDDLKENILACKVKGTETNLLTYLNKPVSGGIQIFADNVLCPQTVMTKRFLWIRSSSSCHNIFVIITEL